MSPEDYRVNAVDGSVLLRVPAGEFVMGSEPSALRRFFVEHRIPLEHLEAFLDETPAAEVTLAEFWIGKYAVTNAQFARFLQVSGWRRGMPAPAATKAHYDRILQGASRVDEFGRYPVGAVSHDEASAYCRWAGVHLPTEAQWEKAARGTDGRVFPWGNEYRAQLANTLESSQPMPDGIFVDALPEGRSPYGCLQMAGNVAEWCADWYEPDAYRRRTSSRDPLGPPSGVERVVRGGATHRPFLYARTTSRDHAPPDGHFDFVGFRVAAAG